MKRSKADHIRSSISRYMKRRQFHESEMPSKRDAKKVQDIASMSVRKRTGLQTNLENTLSLSSISGDTTACDQQYTKLKTFILGAIKPFDADLLPVLFPVFVQIYLEMLCNGHRVPAHKFLERHSDTFQEQSQRQLLLALRKMESKTDVVASKEITKYREHKFVLSTTQAALDYLMRHLKMKTSMIVLQLFNKHIQVNVRDNESHTTNGSIELPRLAAVDNDDDAAVNVKQEVTPEVKTEVVGEEGGGSQEPTLLEKLESAIKAVQEMPPSLPSICFYTFLNTYQGLTSTTISPDKTRLAGTFEDSTINVWSLEPDVFSPDPPDVDVSRITLASDFIHSTEEEIKERMSIRVNASTEVAKLVGHRSNVFKAQFMSHTNQYVLSCSADRTVRLWDMKTQSNTVIYQGHNWPVWDCSISPSDTWFATCCHDTTAKLWSFDRTYPLRSFVGHTFDVDCVEFHPNSSYLATGSGDKTVRFWNINDGRTVRLFQSHRGSILSLAFSPDGKLLASAGEDRRIRVWDLGSGQVLKELRGHSDIVYALAFDESSAVLASGGADCCVRIWDVKKSHDAPLREGESSPDLIGAFPTKSALVSYLKFAPFNVLMATGTSS